MNLLEKYGIESIHFQLKSKLHFALTEICDSIKSNIDLEIKNLQGLHRRINDSMVNKIVYDFYKKNKSLIETHIEKETGLKTFFILDRSDTSFIPGASVRIENLDSNHPLILEFQKELMSISDRFIDIIKKKEKYSALVDKKNGKVSGYFSKIPFNIYVNYSFFKGILDGKEMSSVILHELGHAFSYCEYMGSYVTTNFVLYEASRRLTQRDREKESFIILSDLEKHLGIKLKQGEQITYKQNQEVIHLVLVREYICCGINELNSKMYDFTAFEMFADQFANRHGAGKDIISALDKIYRLGGDSAYWSGKKHVYVETMKTLFVLPIFTALTAGLFLYFIFFVVNTNASEYDTPVKRFERIKRDLINALKDRNLSNELRKKINDDIEQIDEILKPMNERKTLLQWYWNTLSIRGRREYNALKFQQELEKLVGNELFVKANQLLLRSES